MILTEEQAKTRWCPMTRLDSSYENNPSLNREMDGSVARGALCIASECMMWREHVIEYEKKHFHKLGDETFDQMYERYEAFGKENPDWTQEDVGSGLLYTKPKPQRGWCGLAGKPQEAA